MRLFLIIFLFAALHKAANTMQISFTKEGGGFAIVPTSTINSEPPLNIYEQVYQARSGHDNLVREIQNLIEEHDCQRIKKQAQLLLNEARNNPYNFLFECTNPECPLSRLRGTRYPERFFRKINDTFFPYFKGTSSDSNGINLLVFSTHQLLPVIKLIDEMNNDGIKINTIYIVNESYKQITENIGNDNEYSFNLESLGVIDAKLVKSTVNYVFESAKEGKPNKFRNFYEPIANSDLYLRLHLLQLLQFRDYISRDEHSPRVVIFDSTYEFLWSGYEANLLFSYDMLMPSILADQIKSDSLMNELVALCKKISNGALFYNDGGHINAITILKGQPEITLYEILNKK